MYKMNAIRSTGHPQVILLGYPVKRTRATNQMKTDDAQLKSFPVLAVTRSSTAPCFAISKTSLEKNSKSEKHSSNTIRENHSISSHSQCKNSTANIKSKPPIMSAKNYPINKIRPRASSLPVWPVTDPNIIRNFTNGATATLPKPKVSPNLVIYRPKRRNSAYSTSLKNEHYHTDQFNNKRCPIIVSGKQPSRSESPMSEYDPDKLNIKQVVKFLDNNDILLSPAKSCSYREVTESRPRPFTVAYIDSNTRDMVKSDHPRHKYRKSPPAAKRYMRSAKSTNSVERALSVSTLVMSDKRSGNRSSRRAKKMEKLANLAARYNPDIKAHNKTETLNVCPQPVQDVDSNLCKGYFGKLKYEAATFQSFPTNLVQIVSDEVCINDPKDDSDGPDLAAEVFDPGVSRTEVNNAQQHISDGAAFNANNAIRLPSVFDNIDTESEVDWKAGYWLMPDKFEQLTVSDISGTPQSDSTLTGPCFRLTSHNNTRDDRHRRNLSMVLARERSSDVPFCTKEDLKSKTKQTRNWINFGLNENSTVVELKLTHGLSPHS